MIKTLAPHANIPTPDMERILFLMRPWTTNIRGSMYWLQRRNFLLYFRSNPRSTEYMLEQANEFHMKYAKEACCDFFLDPRIEEEGPYQHRSWISKELTELSSDELAKSNYDTIVFLYSDAIGLGWEGVERKMHRLKTAQYIVINGRRRIFVWDATSRRALAFRRLVSRAWWLELFLSPVLWIVAMILAQYDAMKRLNNKQGTGHR